MSLTTWQEAQAAIASRVRPGRGTVKLEKALLAPVCGNPECDATGKHPSPMYRSYTPYGKEPGFRYRCTGSGPMRKGCGFTVPVSELDEVVIDSMLSDDQRHYERKFIPGDDTSDQIAKLREIGAGAMRKGDYDGATDAMRKASEIEAQPRVEPHWESQPTNMSEGFYFAGLGESGRREYLRRFEVVAYRDDDGRVCALIVPRWAVAS